MPPAISPASWSMFLRTVCERLGEREVVTGEQDAPVQRSVGHARRCRLSDDESAGRSALRLPAHEAGPAAGRADSVRSVSGADEVSRSALHATRATNMPTSIAGTKSSASSTPAPRSAIAGPGHSPTRPPPTPNAADPATSRRLTPRLCVRAKTPPSTGAARRSTRGRSRAKRPIAPPITNSKLGSHSPARSRTLRTPYLLFVPGALFGVGLAVSGMTNPAKVIGCSQGTSRSRARRSTRRTDGTSSSPQAAVATEISTG